MHNIHWCISIFRQIMLVVVQQKFYFRCSFCGIIFDSISHRERHEQRHKDNDTFQVLYCTVHCSTVLHCTVLYSCRSACAHRQYNISPQYCREQGRQCCGKADLKMAAKWSTPNTELCRYVALENYYYKWNGKCNWLKRNQNKIEIKICIKGTENCRICSYWNINS